jgi:serine/threonine protein kinase
MSLTTGQVLQGRYHIANHVGQGGMGAVYQAQDLRLNQRWVAIKEFDPAQLAPGDRQMALQAFQREATILAQLSHPGLTAIHDYFSENGKFYLVMEFVAGQTLQQAWEQRGRRFAEAQVVGWVRQLCDVLSFLHNQRPAIIFRDLKPSNIMIQPDGRLKLIDFGIARHFDPDKTSDTVRFGTPGYAAPEQYGQGQTDARSDVYALAAITHQLLTGHDPSSSPFQLPDISNYSLDVSSGVLAAVQQGLKMNMAERPSSAEAFCKMICPDDLAHPMWFWLVGGMFLLLILTAGLFILTQQENSTTTASLPEIATATHTPMPSGDILVLATETPIIIAVVTDSSTPESKLSNGTAATVVPLATSSPTPEPTVTNTVTPTPMPVAVFTSLSLAAVANAEMDFLHPPVETIVLQGILFQIEPRIFKSQASPSPHNAAPTSAFITADIITPYRLYLLLNSGNGFARFNNRVIGRLNVICNDEAHIVADLRLGQNIREWHSANNVVSYASQTEQVWQGVIAGHPNLTGHIDMLVLDLPLPCQNGKLDAVELLDTSLVSVQSLDPALNLIAITVEHYVHPVP